MLMKPHTGGARVLVVDDSGDRARLGDRQTVGERVGSRRVARSRFAADGVRGGRWAIGCGRCRGEGTAPADLHLWQPRAGFGRGEDAL